MSSKKKAIATDPTELLLGAKEPRPQNLIDAPVVGRSVDARELGVVAGLLFRNYVTGETINVAPVNYGELRRITTHDGQAKGLLRLITMPVINAKWDILSADEDQEVTSNSKTTTQQVAGTTSSDERDQINENLFAVADEGGMSIPFTDVLAVMALAVRDGFKAFEKVFALNDRGKIILRKLAYRDNDTVSLITDTNGDFNGFRQRTNFSGQYIDVTFPKEKSLLYTFGKEDSHLYGSPLFLPVYYHLDKKNKLYYISHIAYQMLAIPPRIGKLPPGGSTPEILAKFLADLSSLGFNSAMYMPNDFEVEAFESSRTLADFMPLIEHHNSMAAKAVLGQFMDLKQSSQGHLAAEQSDIFIMGIVSILKDIEKIYNNWVIPQLTRFNFTTKKYPKLRARAFTDSDQEALRDVFEKIMTAGTPHVSPEFLAKLEQKMAGIMDIKNIDYAQVAVDMKDRQELLQKQAEAALTQPGGSPGGPKPKGGGGAKPPVPGVPKRDKGDGGNK